MSENTSETKETAANGVTHGAPNGATGPEHHPELREEAKPATTSLKVAEPAPHNKKKHKHKHRGGKPTPPASTPTPPAAETPVEASAPIDEPIDARASQEQPAEELVEPSPQGPQETASPEQLETALEPATPDLPQEQPSEMSSEQPAVPIEAPSFLPWPESLPQQEEPIPPPPQAAVAVEGLRLRMKVWTDSTTGKRYLMPTAFMRDIRNGQPISDVMYAYAMRDDDTKLVTLTAREWNALPFFYFEENGPAPRATTRPVDVIR